MNIETNTIRIDDENVELIFTVSLEDVEKAFHSAYAHIAATRSIKGFRKGKIPKDIIKSLVGAEGITSMTLNELLPDAYMEAVDKAAIFPVGEPEFDPFPTLEEGKPFEARAKITVLPDFEPADYKSIRINQDRAVIVEDSEVERTLNNIRKSVSEFFPVIDDRTAQAEDKITFDYKMTEPLDDGSEKILADYKGVAVVLGENEIFPEVENNLIGLKIGDDKSFTMEFPEDASKKEHSEKKITVQVHVTAIETRQLHDIDEEFLKKIGNFKTAEDLTDQIKNTLKYQKESLRDQQALKAAIDFVVSNTHLKVPEKLIETEVEHRITTLEDLLEQENRSIEDFAEERGITVEQLKEDETKDARITVKQDFIFDRIFTLENMQLTEHEIRMRLNMFASEQKLTITQLKKKIKDRDFMDRFRRQLKDRKVMSLLLQNTLFNDDPIPGAKPADTSEEPSAAEPAAAPDAE